MLTAVPHPNPPVRPPLPMPRRSHTGEKPFPCRVPGCTKSYAHRPGLNYHMAAAHTGARPYRCTALGCDAAFPGASALKVHMQSTRYHARVAQQYAAAQAAAAASAAPAGASGHGPKAARV